VTTEILSSRIISVKRKILKTLQRVANSFAVRSKPVCGSVPGCANWQEKGDRIMAREPVSASQVEALGEAWIKAGNRLLIAAQTMKTAKVDVVELHWQMITAAMFDKLERGTIKAAEEALGQVRVAERARKGASGGKKS
jgi:hypothetical protein